MQCIGVLNIDIDTTSTNLHYTISRLLCVKHIYKKPLPPNIVHSSKYRWQNWGTELVHIYTVYCEYCDCTDPVCVSWHFMCPALGSNQSPSLLPQLGTKLPRFCQRSKNIRNRLRPGFKIGSQSISETERLVWAQPSPGRSSLAILQPDNVCLKCLHLDNFIFTKQVWESSIFCSSGSLIRKLLPTASKERKCSSFEKFSLSFDFLWELFSRLTSPTITGIATKCKGCFWVYWQRGGEDQVSLVAGPGRVINLLLPDNTSLSLHKRGH